ncbi:MAG: VOC family protein, partial [Nitrolancea sp.]
MPDRRPIKGLGEIAFRVEDLDRMQEFYENVVGLELMRRFPDSAFFRIAAGVAGHTQILALFDRRSREGYQGIESEHTTVDHIAFGIALEDHQSELERLQ